MRNKNKSTAEKLDLVLLKLDNIDEKVDKQNKEIADLQQQVKELQFNLDELVRKNRNQALLAGGIGGGVVALGIELIRLKFGG
ncbi:hypothetical protein GVX81_02930 [[Haemophilus] felis]|uniref:Uncharacterized protein n=1 Tax=[Haemophilus] felis TaxID=123822 RepID=A0A1T0BAN4_9PAST|nr:hypothetical protein [[Haemophilus] felis]NBI40375.1 hypothetical protein [[Haemophilus] felis]OOS07104.1 hypothetical protein B0188_01600 [[Haemophilus] felis]